MTNESLAVVIGAGGGIGAAFVGALRAGGDYRDVVAFSRAGTPPLDITDEGSLRVTAARRRPSVR
jgi:dTDP-4-dehydrorhamnose reductase